MSSAAPLLLPCRLCEPYITQELVYSTFGQQMGQEVASRSAGLQAQQAWLAEAAGITSTQS